MTKSPIFRITIGLSIVLIVVFTVNVLTIDKNPILFSIDFVNKHQIIISYASLVGTILTFISIIFVLANIIQQKMQYENDKLIEKQKIKNDLYSRLLLIKNILEQLAKHVQDTGVELKNFYETESKFPLKGNVLNFYTNKSYYRLLELDYLSIYNSFQTFGGNEKEKHFNNLYSIVDFYSQAFPEMKEKYQIYQKEKLQNKRDIVALINKAINSSAELCGNLKENYPDKYKEMDWFILFNNLVAEYYDFIKKDENNETDFIELSETLFKPFIENALSIESKKPLESIEENIRTVSKIRKQIFAVKFEALDMSNNVRKRFDEYFSEDSSYFLKLKTLENNIEKLLI